MVLGAGIGGMSPFAARRLRRLARAAAELGTDRTDYRRSYTVSSFVPFFAQRLSSASVMEGAAGLLAGVKRDSCGDLRRAAAARRAA